MTAHSSLPPHDKPRQQADTDLERLFELSLDMLCIANAESYFTRLSPSCTRTLGWSLDELMSRPFLDFVHPDDRASTILEVERQIGRGEPVLEFQNRYQHKNGTWRLLSWKSSPHPDGHLYAIARDVTEREQAQQVLQRSHQELEHRVQERTAELQQRNGDLETLLYITSHDLREPIRSISNFSQLVRERYGDRLDSKGTDYIDRIIRSAQRMDQLMEDLLTLSRAQRLEMPYEEVRGDDLVIAALTQLDETIRRTGARVEVAANFPSFRVNTTWITQALYNLIANALKFHRDGEVPDIEVAPFWLAEDSRPLAGIVVRDRGIGVEPDQAHRIFQLFQRAVGREVSGTGAGLAIVQQIAHRHGGRAWVQPRDGGGSEFFLLFGSQSLINTKPTP
ncbi:MAG: PAS domain S-box protein [Nitrospira sp. CR1.1]|jgi:PAS domain S-box-containing protein|nr:PAS domain S-box protein [Nitrospira sp. CR1.1]